MPRVHVTSCMVAGGLSGVGVETVSVVGVLDDPKCPLPVDSLMFSELECVLFLPLCLASRSVTVAASELASVMKGHVTTLRIWIGARLSITY